VVASLRPSKSTRRNRQHSTLLSSTHTIPVQVQVGTVGLERLYRTNFEVGSNIEQAAVAQAILQVMTTEERDILSTNLKLDGLDLVSNFYL
jgi:hypothetical protein